MRAVAVIALIGLSLAACGESAPASVPVPAEVAPIPLPVATIPAMPMVLTADQLRRVCQTGLAAIHGQTVADIQIDGVEGRIVSAWWRAPVDGGRRRAQCRVDGDRVVWKPLERLTPRENRWMDQAGDPVTRFVLDGETVRVNQTPPDDATGLADGAEPAAGE